MGWVRLEASGHFPTQKRHDQVYSSKSSPALYFPHDTVNALSFWKYSQVSFICDLAICKVKNCYLSHYL